MKKLAAILLVGILVTSCVSCGRANDNGNGQNNTQNNTQNNVQNNTTDTQNANKGTESTNTTVDVKDATELLTKIWNTYEAVDTDNNMYNDRFPILGGHQESYTNEAPGQYDITKTADLERSLCFPADKVELIDDAATMVHLMHANTFSAGAYHVKDASKINEVAKAISDCTMRNQWLDGEPDELLIVTIGDNYVVSAFGEDELIDYFRAGIQTVYGDSAKIVIQKDID